MYEERKFLPSWQVRDFSYKPNVSRELKATDSHRFLAQIHPASTVGEFQHPCVVDLSKSQHEHSRW
jgi:hypothetical protein